ncbi:MazG nucleotide pyrophosphohydrolase domain-containing protein [Zhihengliuella sp.]|uniref:MazG nucleotide pyrophosphohydrolase domain-containing protein n=1 Tax=Zhihengliuella sp. TaxID=1954483 RepID=UPI0028111688|nr:MazG nucleotide pyrophosphohydrolase domain-containing protein [Zhihengliuella sp.]
MRTHCAWTRRLTHASLVEYLVEESYELVEAIEDARPPEEIRGELADVLLQVVLHASIAAEHGSFDFADVAEELSDKMVRRNRHIFAADGSLLGDYPDSIEEIVASWDAAKRAEREAPGTAEGSAFNPLQSLPRHLPALSLADKALGRAARWEAARTGAGGAGAPARRRAGGRVEPDEPQLADEDQLGDHLLELVALARERGWDAERALRGAVTRFTDDVTRALG